MIVSMRLIAWQQMSPRVHVRLTLVFLHAPTLETLVQQTNAQSYIDAHAFLVDHACNSVLDENIGTVGTELVATVGHL